MSGRLLVLIDSQFPDLVVVSNISEKSVEVSGNICGCSKGVNRKKRNKKKEMKAGTENNLLV